MNCKYYRTRTKNYKKIGFCTRDRKIVPLFCKECDVVEYKDLKKLKSRTNKQAKSERKRFSILTSSNKCCMCPSVKNLTWHEVFRGRNRTNSMKYGLCLRMCLNCHEKYQESKNFNDYWHKKGQAIFNETYPDLEFLDIFKRNYL